MAVASESFVQSETERLKSEALLLDLIEGVIKKYPLKYFCSNLFGGSIRDAFYSDLRKQ